MLANCDFYLAIKSQWVCQALPRDQPGKQCCWFVCPSREYCWPIRSRSIATGDYRPSRASLPLSEARVLVHWETEFRVAGVSARFVATSPGVVEAIRADL